MRHRSRCFFLLALLIALRLGAQFTSASTQEPTAPSTREMGAILREIYLKQDWKTDPNKSDQRAAYYRAVLKRSLALSTEITIRQALAQELLNAGDSAGAINTFDPIFARHLILPSGTLLAVHSLLGLAYLRLGEQENCLAHHATKSCIFPVDTEGMHHRPEGAEGAVREFTTVLQSDPKDQSARWLLNLAYMQLGRYPAGVPRSWLISPSLFRSEHTLPRFDDVAAEAGVGITGRAGGAVMEDFDGDGLLDLAVTSSGPMDQMQMFHNRGDGTFENVTRKAGLVGEIGGLNMICADYDNDGHPDLVVLRGGWWAARGDYPFSLLHNRGDGTFEDVTRKAGLFSPHPTQTAAFLDFDNDGWLDLFVPHESTPGDPYPSQLFRNNHDGTFTDIAKASGVADLGFVKGVAVGDYNNDGRPDLYVSVKGASNRLFRNDGPYRGDDSSHPSRWKFTDVTATAHVAEPIESFTTWFFDYDNDGWPDLFVAGYSSTAADIGAFESGLPSRAEVPHLYHNEHNGAFRDVTHSMRLDRAILIMGASFGDLDNDGWLDVYLGTGDSLYTSLLPNRMFRNDSGRGFQDVTTAGGFGHLQKGHSIAFGDIENDGDE
ncbi:MAG: FG-GAP-like repeat-containing protein, partial [Acidobacteriaceae bacterium]